MVPQSFHGCQEKEDKAGKQTTDACVIDPFGSRILLDNQLLKRFYLFIFRKREREGERKGEKQ